MLEDRSWGYLVQI